MNTYAFKSCNWFPLTLFCGMIISASKLGKIYTGPTSKLLLGFMVIWNVYRYLIPKTLFKRNVLVDFKVPRVHDGLLFVFYGMWPFFFLSPSREAVQPLCQCRGDHYCFAVETTISPCGSLWLGKKTSQCHNNRIKTGHSYCVKFQRENDGAG